MKKWGIKSVLIKTPFLDVELAPRNTRAPSNNRESPSNKPFVSQIEVLDVFSYHGSVSFGLSVKSNLLFPLLVGCSLRTVDGAVIDVPAKWISSSGLALWSLEAPPECRASAEQAGYNDSWQGAVIFALWEDLSWTRRLCDTGWIPWTAPFLIGASTKPLDSQDADVISRYGKRLNVLSPS